MAQQPQCHAKSMNEGAGNPCSGWMSSQPDARMNQNAVNVPLCRHFDERTVRKHTISHNIVTQIQHPPVA